MSRETMMKFFPRKIILALSVTWGLILLTGTLFPIQAQLAAPASDLEDIVQLNFKRPTVSPDQGSPTGRQEGAGSHSSQCQLEPTKTTPLVALVPQETGTDGTSSYVWGKTTVPHPAFWFYVAYPPETHVMFELQDEEEKEIYTTSFILKGTPGVVSVTLPPTIQLETGRRYLWYFYVFCHSQDSPDDFVSGWVERVALSPALESQLAQAKAIQRVALYADSGIWQDAIT
ncbi:MAG: DUF928 domain-containing protein, partial [Microcystaceae cyanobacterium]